MIPVSYDLLFACCTHHTSNTNRNSRVLLAKVQIHRMALLARKLCLCGYSIVRKSGKWKEHDILTLRVSSLLPRKHKGGVCMDNIDEDIKKARIGKRDEPLNERIWVSHKNPMKTNYPPMSVNKFRKCKKCGKRKPIEEFQRGNSVCVYDDFYLCNECSKFLAQKVERRHKRLQEIEQNHKIMHNEVMKNTDRKPLCQYCDLNICGYKIQNSRSYCGKNCKWFSDSIYCPFL